MQAITRQRSGQNLFVPRLEESDPVIDPVYDFGSDRTDTALSSKVSISSKDQDQTNVRTPEAQSTIGAFRKS